MANYPKQHESLMGKGEAILFEARRKEVNVTLFLCRVVIKATMRNFLWPLFMFLFSVKGP